MQSLLGVVQPGNSCLLSKFPCSLRALFFISMKPESTGRSIALAALYFLFGTLITVWFIARKFWLYDSVELMILSGSIAGAKWFIQLIAAVILLREQRWTFIKNIGLVCLIGSAALLIYYFLPTSWGFAGLTTSVAFSVLIMIILYYRAVRQSAVSIYWFWSWIVCLLAAILLQLTVVFDAL